MKAKKSCPKSPDVFSLLRWGLGMRLGHLSYITGCQTARMESRRTEIAAASVPYIFLLHISELWWALFLQNLFTVSSDG